MRRYTRQRLKDGIGSRLLSHQTVASQPGCRGSRAGGRSLTPDTAFAYAARETCPIELAPHSRWRSHGAKLFHPCVEPKPQTIALHRLIQINDITRINQL